MTKFIILSIFLLLSNLIFSITTKNNKKTLLTNLLLTIIILIVLYLQKNNLTITKFTTIYLINNLLLSIINYKKLKIILKKDKLKYLIITFFILNISILLELTILNFRTYTTKSYKTLPITSQNIETNLTKISDNKYKVATKETAYIEIKNINQKVNNIYFDITCSKNDSYYIVPFYTDSANELYQQLESRIVSTKINKSKILNFNTSGPSKKLKFEFSFNKDEIVTFNNIIINYPIPLEVNIIRVILLFGVLLFIYFLRPKSKLYEINFNKIRHKKLIIIGLVILIITSFSAMSIKSILSIAENESNIHNKLADSLIDGKTYFKDDNNSEKILKTMTNPYDYNLREKTFKEKNTYYLWDCAYYKGKYYSYFGVVPVILFYIPYKLITHHDLQTPFINYILSMLSAIMLVILLYQIVKKYFKKCSLGLFLILSLALIYCSGILYILKLPSLYAVPIISGLLFTFIGLNLLISCLTGKSSKIKIFLGGLSLALVAGCRPQLLLGSLFVIPIIYLYLKEKKTHKEIITNAITLCIPYVLVAIGIMYYNYIRFGSIFDFGANYNLTTNDMTNRGFSVSRIPLGICLYLLNPVNVKNIFPYIIGTDLQTNYLGVTIYEPVYGGVFLSVAFTSINLFIFKLKKKMNNKFIFNICLLCIISALVIVIVDTQMAGILARYITDFSWLLIFSSILIALALYESGKIQKKTLTKIIFVLITLSLLYQFFYYFVSINDSFKTKNLRLWLEFYYLIQFWL